MTQAQRAGKVVAAAGRDHQHRQSELHELTQVPVDGAIAAKEQNDVRLIRSGRQPDAPIDRCIGLEGLQVFRRRSQPENGSGPHVRG